MSPIDQLQLDESNIVFHPFMGNNYQVNDISKEIISLLQKKLSKQQILEILSLEYDISEEELYIDVDDFISKLKIYSLI